MKSFIAPGKPFPDYELPDHTKTIRKLSAQLGAEYPFLYDERHRVRDDLDIAGYTDPQHEPMIPHTFVLGPGLKICNIRNGYYWGPSVAELHQALRAVAMEIRRPQ